MNCGVHGLSLVYPLQDAWPPRELPHARRGGVHRPTRTGCVAVWQCTTGTNAELLLTLHIWVDNVAGISNAVGMAIAQSHIAANFNVAGEEPVSDHFTYVICGKLPR